MRMKGLTCSWSFRCMTWFSAWALARCSRSFSARYLATKLSSTRCSDTMLSSLHMDPACLRKLCCLSGCIPDQACQLGQTLAVVLLRHVHLMATFCCLQDHLLHPDLVGCLARYTWLVARLLFSQCRTVKLAVVRGVKCRQPPLP